ncbi:hypothetical protein AJO04nite_04890 [Acinetobacter johnsonii]|uniref:GGDEF domain-containing protein n=1 Tax=Acinetobacter johnsonii TaxID=40214 RepID=A0AAV3VJJ7_ACIJO|nr:hypothetical protein [Acinetobacter johnsonii]GEK43231.1 hypothetical protein AJO04nite_04890 [Acinetobacter johnsonii]
MSIGCGLYPDDANDLSELLKCADTALNDVKAQGRGGMRMFDQDMFLMRYGSNLNNLIVRIKLFVMLPSRLSFNRKSV